MKAKVYLVLLMLVGLLPASACLPSGEQTKGGRQITLYGFSIMKEPLEKEIFPAFAAKWKREHNEDITFIGSYAGSEFITNQILQGTPADVAILSIERDAQRLMEAKAVTTDWRQYPQKGIVNKTPFVILVRKGNPKGIKDFPDLAKPGLKIIHPDPISSGGAQWSILAIYGSELEKSKRANAQPDTARALQTLQGLWNNVFSTPGSAREARTQFETGYGDALITYELEGLAMKQAGQSVEIVTPLATIFSEHPVVIIDRNMTGVKRPMVEEFIRFLWSDEAQQAFVKYFFRSTTNEAFNNSQTAFAKIEEPFTVELFGGWSKAYPDVIEGVFRKQVGKK